MRFREACAIVFLVCVKVLDAAKIQQALQEVVSDPIVLVLEGWFIILRVLVKFTGLRINAKL